MHTYVVCHQSTGLYDVYDALLMQAHARFALNVICRCCMRMVNWQRYASIHPSIYLNACTPGPVNWLIYLYNNNRKN